MPNKGRIQVPKRSKGQRVYSNPRILESSNPKVVAIIPARYNSTRLPGKPLLDILGKPMIQHVWEKTKAVGKVNKVIVATDNEKIYNAVERFGGEAIMTSKSHITGTDRIAEVVKSLSSGIDIIVNIQGDEPTIEPDMVDQVISVLSNDSRASIGTLCKMIEDVNEIMDPNIVKVVFDKEGFALYFSRLPIPFYRNGKKETKGNIHYKHLGIYSYRREALLSLSSTKPTPLEIAEKLEQLRAIENGMRIKVGLTFKDTIGVDTNEDLERVIKYMSNRGA